MIEMSNADYHSSDALGSSLLAQLLKNAKIFKMMVDGKYKIRSKALDFGSAFHAFILEPEKFDDMVIVDDRYITTKIRELVESGVDVDVYPDECLTASGRLGTSKAAKEAIASLDNSKVYLTPSDYELYELAKIEADGKIILSTEDVENMKRMRDKLYKLPRFEEFMDVGRAERSFFAEIDGVKLRCRPDLIVKTTGGKYIVIDLKTMSGEAVPENFAKSSANYLYYLQEAVYRRVLAENGYEVEDFIFAGVSKLEESGAAYFRHDYVARDEGAALMYKALFKYKWCVEHDEWREDKFDFVNGGFSKINDVVLPSYAFYQFL